MDENTIRRVQPHNEKAEQGIVGTMLVNRDAISDLVDMLTGEDFYNKQYGILFDNMVELYSEGASVDPITLVERLRMKDIPEEVAKKAKYMVVSLPSNPVGSIATPGLYEEIVEFAKKYDILIIHDNAYSDIIFDGAFGGSFLATLGAKEIGVEFFSLSKSFNVTGARLSFLVGRPDVIAALRKLRSQIDFGMFLPLQKAAVAALEGPLDSVKEQCQMYEERRDALCQGLRDIGWELPNGKGTMFVWAKIPGGRTDSMAFCMELMEKAGVIVTPGASFGPHGEGYVRFALVLPPEKIREAVEAIGNSGITVTK